MLLPLHLPVLAFKFIKLTFTVNWSGLFWQIIHSLAFPLIFVFLRRHKHLVTPLFWLSTYLLNCPLTCCQIFTLSNLIHSNFNLKFPKISTTFIVFHLSWKLLEFCAHFDILRVFKIVYIVISAQITRCLLMSPQIDDVKVNTELLLLNLSCKAARTISCYLDLQQCKALTEAYSCRQARQIYCFSSSCRILER